MEYKVINERFLDDLELEVNLALYRGWTLHGNLLVIAVGGIAYPGTEYIQVMTREKYRGLGLNTLNGILY